MVGRKEKKEKEKEKVQIISSSINYLMDRVDNKRFVILDIVRGTAVLFRSRRQTLSSKSTFYGRRVIMLMCTRCVGDGNPNIQTIHRCTYLQPMSVVSSFTFKRHAVRGYRVITNCNRHVCHVPWYKSRTNGGRYKTNSVRFGREHGRITVNDRQG